MTILAVTGLVRERDLVKGPGIVAIAGGGDSAGLEAVIEREAARVAGIISVGIAGGLAPRLRPGDWVVADAVLAGDEALPTDPAWRDQLAELLPQAEKGLMLGSDRPIATAAHKAEVHRASGALAVDMESQVAARVARRHRVRFAVARVIADPAQHTLPPAALVAMRRDGTIDLSAVLRSLLVWPWQLPALILTGLDAERAFGALRRGLGGLGRGLGAPDLGELAVDVP